MLLEVLVLAPRSPKSGMSISFLALSKSLLNPGNMHCRVLGIRGEQITGGSVSPKGCWYGCNQLLVCKLLKQIERLPAGSGQIREKRFHVVIAMGIHISLIALVCGSQPCLSAHSGHIAGQSRFAAERAAQYKPDSAFICRKMGKVILSSPGNFA